jgi:hypothetical protein
MRHTSPNRAFKWFDLGGSQNELSLPFVRTTATWAFVVAAIAQAAFVRTSGKPFAATHRWSPS